MHQAYELIREENLKDINAKGYVLRHKKVAHILVWWKTMMKIRCFTLDSVHPRQTLPEYPIL